MTGFLNDLTGLDKIFLVCAVFGGTLFVLWTLMQVIFGGHGHGGGMDIHTDIPSADFHTGGADMHGGGAHGGDASMDGSADAALSFRALSLQGIMAFLLMFGLVGLTTHSELHLYPSLSLVCAFAAGMAMIWVMDRIMRALSQLQTSGTLNMENAIGEKGTIYLRIPAGGTGETNVVVQGRLMTLDAIAQDKEEMSTDAQVEVVGVENGILVVRKAR